VSRGGADIGLHVGTTRVKSGGESAVNSPSSDEEGWRSERRGGAERWDRRTKARGGPDDQPDLSAAGDVGPNGVRPRTSGAGPYKREAQSLCFSHSALLRMTCVTCLVNKYIP
jgi:hypothetical protein